MAPLTVLNEKSCPKVSRLLSLVGSQHSQHKRCTLTVVSVMNCPMCIFPHSTQYTTYAGNYSVTISIIHTTHKVRKYKRKRHDIPIAHDTALLHSTSFSTYYWNLIKVLSNLIMCFTLPHVSLSVLPERPGLPLHQSRSEEHWHCLPNDWRPSGRWEVLGSGQRSVGIG